MSAENDPRTEPYKLTYVPQVPYNVIDRFVFTQVGKLDNEE